MSKKDDLLSGISVSLVLALYRMLEIRPCRNRLPCFKQNNKDIAKKMFNNFWQTLTLEQKEEFNFRLLQCLYYRRLKCFESWEHFMEIFERNLGLEEGFDKWRESLNFDGKKPLMLVLRVLRCKKVPLSFFEIKYCLSALGPEGEEKIARIVYKLLLLGCHKVRINYSKDLCVKYTKDREDWNLFPST